MRGFSGAAFRTLLKASVAAGAILGCGLESAQAAEAEGGSAQVGEVIVTGTNLRESAAIGPSVQVTREEIEKQGFLDVGQVLRSVPFNFSGGVNIETLVANVPADGAQNNRAGVSSPNLLGLGSGATLTLFNGRRLPVAGEGIAVDLSLIPLVAIERVDMLADGASAIYGTDAVAGVVNVITRRTYDGVETRLRYGGADGGLDTTVASILAGRTWDKVSAVVGVEILSQEELKASKRERSSLILFPTTLVGDSRRASIYGSAKVEVTPRLRAYADGLYMQRFEDTVLRTPTQLGLHTRKVSQYAFSAGVSADVAEAWVVDAFASANSNISKVPGAFRTLSSGLVSASNFDVTNDLWSVEARATGHLLDLSAGGVETALGVAYREEKLTSRFAARNSGQRELSSVYAEVNVPLVSSKIAMPGVDLLRLTLAGRRDDYSDFGSVSVPKVGLEWRPIPDVKIGASYSESFRAPSAFDSGVNYYGVILDAVGNSGTTRTLYLGGTGAPLTPERSENINISVDYEPSWFEGLRISLAYYDIDYTDRIASPDPTTAFGFDHRRAPSGLVFTGLDQQTLSRLVAGAYQITPFNVPADISQIATVVDMRNTNIAATHIDGWIGGFDYATPLAGGDLALSLQVSYISDFTDRLQAGAPAVRRVGEIFSPPKIRSRAGATWTSPTWSSSLYWNHADDYRDARMASNVRRVKRWDTFDASLAYDFSGAGKGWSSGLRVVASATNLFDADPPYIASSGLSPATWDSTNSSIIGRFLSLEVIKAW